MRLVQPSAAQSDQLTGSRSITLPTTAYFSETETTTATAAATVTVGALVRRSPDELPAPVCSLSPANCINPATDCINLSVFNLLQFPAQLLRDICYCMGVAPRTVTYGDLTATVPTNTPTVTAWAVETDVVTDTITGTAYSEVLLTETDMVTAVSRPPRDCPSPSPTDAFADLSSARPSPPRQHRYMLTLALSWHSALMLFGAYISVDNRTCPTIVSGGISVVRPLSRRSPDGRQDQSNW